MKITRERFVSMFCPQDLSLNHQIYSGHSTSNNNLIWTQIGDEEENKGQPAIDIWIYDNRIEIYDREEGISFVENVDFPLPNVKEFHKLEKKINDILTLYYSRFVEQPRYIRRTDDL